MYLTLLIQEIIPIFWQGKSFYFIYKFALGILLHRSVEVIYYPAPTLFVRSCFFFVFFVFWFFLSIFKPLIWRWHSIYLLFFIFLHRFYGSSWMAAQQLKLNQSKNELLFILNAAAQLVFILSKFFHTSPLQLTHHWLPASNLQHWCLLPKPKKKMI